MNIHFLPINIYGAVDIKTEDIFISNLINLNDQIDTIYHELAHMETKNEKHDDKWNMVYKNLGGKKHYRSSVCKIGNLYANIGNITGLNQMLTDYHLLQSYRKWSQRVLGTEGRWEVIDQDKIKLFPVPKGSYPVVVRYLPRLSEIKRPSEKQLIIKFAIAQAKIIIGESRRKYKGGLAVAGNTIQLNGEELVNEGREEVKEVISEASIQFGEPPPIILW